MKNVSLYAGNPILAAIAILGSFICFFVLICIWKYMKNSEPDIVDAIVAGVSSALCFIVCIILFSAFAYEFFHIKDAKPLDMLDNTEVVRSYTTSGKYSEYILILMDEEGYQYRIKVPENYFIQYTPGTWIRKGEDLRLE